MQLKHKTFCIVTLGCRTNLCESNVIVAKLIKHGAEQVDDISKATIAIINTCCVTNRAVIKSRYYVNRLIRSKTCKLIAIVGCLSQLDKEFVKHPKIGIILGSHFKNNIVEYLKKYESPSPLVLVKPFSRNDLFDEYQIDYFYHNTRAFLKIQDGCDFMCSYCIIPFVRGRQRSLSHKFILEMIEKLVEKNVKEIILTGVNTAGYLDKNHYDFTKLLIDINKLPGRFRVRISSLEPFQINNQIIDLIVNNPNRWCQHFHLCLQNASDKILREMNRHYVIDEFLKICKNIRQHNDLISITTDYIVGFPSETNKDFEESLMNLQKINFSDIHIFPFSSRPFTKASKLPNIVTEQMKRMRYLKINSLRLKTQLNYLKSFVGKKVNVLFERSKKCNVQAGHSEYFFTVKVYEKTNLSNKMLQVRITKLVDHQLFGEIA